MHVTYPLPHLIGGLLLAAAPSFSAAESPMPDPIAPAVIGRPLDEIRPVRPARQKQATKKASRPKQASAGNRTAPKRAAAPVPAARAVANVAPAPRQVARPVAAQRDPRTVAGAAPATHAATRQFGPGSYFSSRDQKLVYDYYAAKPLAGPAPTWKIGERIPPKAALTGVPDAVRAALPPLPPGHQYVQVDGEVVLVALPSRTVVDGISRGGR